MILAIYLTGFAVTAFLVFIGSKGSSNSVSERLAASVLYGMLSWLFVAGMLAISISRIIKSKRRGK